jgi:hypothetical protein
MLIEISQWARVFSGNPSRNVRESKEITAM